MNIVDKNGMTEVLLSMLSKKVYAHFIEPGETYIVEGNLLAVILKKDQLIFYINDDTKPLFSCFSFNACSVDEVVHNVIFIKS